MVVPGVEYPNKNHLQQQIETILSWLSRSQFANEDAIITHPQVKLHTICQQFFQLPHLIEPNVVWKTNIGSQPNHLSSFGEEATRGTEKLL
jgi:hypothetical protein